MPDINLLQNNHPQKSPEGGAVPNSLNTIGLIILVLFVVISIGSFYLATSTSSQDKTVIAQTAEVEQKVTSLPNYTQFVTEQNSLNGLAFLLQNHLDWSQPMANIAGVTLNSVVYTNVTLNQDGTASLQGTIPSYADLDQYLQALNDKTISPFIASATLQNVTNAPSDTGGTISVGSTPVPSVSLLSFTVNITFGKTIWNSKTSAVPSQ